MASRYPVRDNPDTEDVVPDGANEMILDDDMLDRAFRINADPFNQELHKKQTSEKDDSLNNRVEGGVYHMMEDTDGQDMRTFTSPPIDYNQESNDETSY